MIYRPRIWRFRRYLLTATPRSLGSKVRLLLTLTDTETADVVWSGHLFSPFDELIQGFDDLASKFAQSSDTEGTLSRINQLVGAASREQDERIHAARESARLAHNLKIKSILSRGEKSYENAAAKMTPSPLKHQRARRVSSLLERAGLRTSSAQSRGK